MEGQLWPRALCYGRRAKKEQLQCGEGLELWVGVTGRMEFDASVHEEATQVTEQLKHTNSRREEMAQWEKNICCS